MSRRTAIISSNLDPRLDLVLGIGAALGILALVVGVLYFMGVGVLAVWSFLTGLPSAFYLALEVVLTIWGSLLLVRGKLTLTGVVLLAVVLYFLFTNPIFLGLAVR